MFVTAITNKAMAMHDRTTLSATNPRRVSSADVRSTQKKNSRGMNRRGRLCRYQNSVFARSLTTTSFPMARMSQSAMRKTIMRT